MKILIPLGTRPEIIKLSPVIRALRGATFGVRVVATGQHFDQALSDSFFTDLATPPDDRWSLEGDEADRVGQILRLAFREVAASRPDLLLLLGDTYTVPLFCLAARRYQVPVAHLEAGLRSGNQASLEEVHRCAAGAMASLHLAPTALSALCLQREGVAQERIRVVGNPVIDTLVQLGVPRTAPAQRRGVIFTAHRPTNVDDPARLQRVIDIALRLAGELAPVTFPVHPRTRLRLQEVDALGRLAAAGIRLLPPLPYPAMIRQLAAARLVVTDSGGLQEEASWLGVPVVVLRSSTPRWEGVQMGTSALTGLNVDAALGAATRFATEQEQVRVAAAPCPYGDGRTAQRVARLLAEPATQALLHMGQPELAPGRA